MLIKHTPDAYEKLQILGAMASDDILSRPGEGQAMRDSRAPYSSPEKNPIPGVYKTAMPNGKFINLMRVMFTDFCKMDCAFCPNSHWVPKPIPRWDVHFGEVDDDRKDSTAPHITFRPQLGGHR